MTIWLPDIADSKRPAYLAIADAIADAIRQGRLRPGDLLPTHRLLADLLGVNVSTVTRAYREAARRRLVGGEVGRGTFVLGVASEAALFALEQRPEGGVIDLSPNTPPAMLYDPDLAGALGDLDEREAARLLHYPTTADALQHARAAAAWLGRRGVSAEPDAIVVCAGAQHAMDSALGAFQELEEIGCEPLVYPGLKAAARRWRRRLHPMAMDAEGVTPGAFEAACRAGVRLAVLSPTLHNPTTATMGLERRQRLVEIARRHDVVIVEEDVYGLLPAQAPPPLAALAPERVLYLTGLSKTVAPGLRIGYLVVPPRLRERLRDASHHTSWYVSPISAALATRWLGDGTAWRRLLAQRRELAARHRLCARQLEGHAWRGEPHCPHVWLTLPPGRSAAFAKQALAAGVVVVPSAVFAVGRACEDGVRISLGAATDRASLAEALARLAALPAGQRRA
ncbi:MAG TPA: PLP-dependent aminotransferase family protein [Thermoanaerobaculaceae bacterium]|mgnify:CR=1 FL=1|nr:PLP-dependent aminotransferase family protein [Thermoanaerobaculaceae bacterium]HRS17637.1 PLP-dependent aminotransferase family protein [Thermoanaerobaculaceae bacterium]